MGYAVLTPLKLPFPIDLLGRPYNSVRTAVRHCDRHHTVDKKVCISKSQYFLALN